MPEETSGNCGDSCDGHAHAPKAKIPVTVITGFLGSGKTTLLSYILENKSHGYKIAVINNEFAKGGVGAPNEMGTKPALSADIYESSSGCLCCGGGDDFRKVLHQLAHMPGKFDYVIVETTGMADPTFSKIFFLDPVLKETFYLDGIVTLVDAKHISTELDRTAHKKVKGWNFINEAKEQLIVADRILINKIDLTTPSKLKGLEKRIAGINPTALAMRTEYSRVPDLNFILKIDSFDLESVLSQDKNFLANRPRRTHDPRIQSATLQLNGKVPSAHFRSWLTSVLAESNKYTVMRAKGMVEFVPEKGVQEGVHIIQAVRGLMDIQSPRTETKLPKSQAKKTDTAQKQYPMVFIGPYVSKHADDIIAAFEDQVASKVGEGEPRPSLEYPNASAGSGGELYRMMFVVLMLLLVYYFF